MNSRFESMFSDAEGRYLSADEVQRMTTYIETLGSRIAAMKAIEAVEDKIVEEVIEEVWRKHADFERRHVDAREKAKRDITLALRYCALAMVRDDDSFLTDKLLYWMRTILQAFHFGQVIDTTYRSLLMRSQANLDARHFRLVEPYLKLTHQILTQER
jgi:hypothetical protein